MQLNVYDLLKCYNIRFVSNILFTLSAFYVAMSSAKRSPRTVSLTMLVSASVVPVAMAPVAPAADSQDFTRLTHGIAILSTCNSMFKSVISVHSEYLILMH